MKPVLYIVIPCYNEEKVLPITSGMFLEKLKSLISADIISDDSRIMFVNDGSRDSTWDIIMKLSGEQKYFTGLSLSRNRGHQNALLAGLTEAGKLCDITISIDCDGQDDINAMDSMVREYLDGAEIVYGVRSSRETDTFFKRTTAQGFYKLMNRMGANVVYNHADYRLLSAKVIKELADTLNDESVVSVFFEKPSLSIFPPINESRTNATQWSYLVIYFSKVEPKR